jgi:hypothetical protein
MVRARQNAEQIVSIFVLIVAKIIVEELVMVAVWVPVCIVQIIMVVTISRKKTLYQKNE